MDVVRVCRLLRRLLDQIKFFKNEAFLDNSVRITMGTREQNRLLIDAVTDFSEEHGLL